MTEPVDTATASDTRPPGPVDRLLRIFGDVRAGEGATVLLMCLNTFLLLMACYILKTARLNILFVLVAIFVAVFLLWEWRRLTAAATPPSA